MRKTLFAVSLFLLILLVGCKQQSIQEDTEVEPQLTITGKVVADIEEPSDLADYNICDNAQTYGLCNKLDASSKKGYKESCCKVHGLCC